jgi:[protein-PII] uridylyltransferase
LPAPLLKEVEPFLEGLPQRYLRIYSPEQVVQHFELSSRLWQDEIQLTLVVNRDLYEFTIVTLDKPGLFATLAGALSAWGMEIVKANAFSNSKGVVVDAFYFKDRFRTLDLNPSEHDRLKRSVAEIIRGQRSLEQLIRSRHGSRKPQAFKVRVETKVILDDESSAQSTVLEVIAQDRPGLLHAIAQVLAECQCNIEIALIDTEGEMALDVFYLTSGGRKVPSILQTSIRDALFERLNADAQQTA